VPPVFEKRCSTTFVQLLKPVVMGPRVRGRIICDAYAGCELLQIRFSNSQAIGFENRHCEPTGRANAHPMTGSAKIPYLAARKKGGSLRRFAPRNDADMTLRSRGRRCPSFASESLPSPVRGRRECRAPDAPDTACAMVVVERTRVSQVTPESPGIPRAMVLTVSFALSLATGLSCHHRPQEACFPGT
jgi:hypothetical protein